MGLAPAAFAVLAADPGTRVTLFMGAALRLPTTGDLFELFRFVIADRSPQRCVLWQNVVKSLVISTAPCEAGAEVFCSVPINMRAPCW